MTGYLPYYHMSAHELAMTMVREVLYNTGITATAGIGTNLYLAKLAMDIVAKHIPADKDGVRIAELDEQSYRYLLWNHRPLTDFWMTGPGTVKRLEAHGIYTMGDLARFSIHGEDRLYEVFGVDAEILIDHAWGYEPCGMEQIKSYKPSTNSISEGQVLTCPYPNDKAKLIVREMAEILMFRLTEKKLVTESITLEIGYDRENVDKGGYRGLTQADRYGRIIPKAAHGTVRFDAPTNLGSTLINESAKLFERITDPALTVRRITINANKVTPDEGIYQVDFFTDTKKLEREKKLQQAMLGIKNKYGKNAVLKASSYEEGATMRQRNAQIDIENFLKGMRRDGRSDSYISKARGMLYQIFQKAEANDLVRRNPVRLAEKMRASGTAKRKEAFTTAEVAHLMKVLPDDRMGLSIRLLLGTGMRMQELLALEPQFIEEDGSVIHIRQAVKVVKGTVSIGSPKSKDSIRDIPVPLNVRPCAIKLRDTTDQFIWESPKTGLPCNPTHFRDVFRKSLEEAGDVRLLTPHSCRHTYVSQMQALGVDIQTIQSIVGHADTEMTEHYLHVQESIRQSAIQLFSEAFSA